MTQPSQPVRAFIEDCYQLISSSSPTVPLHGNDLSKGIQFLNELLAYYSGTGLMLTVSQEAIFSVGIGEGYFTFSNTGYVPDLTYPNFSQYGRLANIENAFINLDGVDYPLIIESRHEFKSSYKYAPLQGLPRYIMLYPETNYTLVQIYPAPSQAYMVFIYGKWQMDSVTSNSTLSGLPSYYIRFLRLAVARDLALYKGREQAWTDKLEARYMEAWDDMQATSSVNLDINVNAESWLNGAWRVRAGI
jgi:hypothetical protein